MGKLPMSPHFHLLARRGSLPLLIVTEDFADVGGAPAVTGGAPLPGDRPLARPMFPNAASRGAPDGGLLLLLLANGGMAPLPVGPDTQRNKVSVLGLYRENRIIGQIIVTLKINDAY